MKIVVYAIAKNEEKFVADWVKSMSEADDIYVLDTGSTDKTIAKLKAMNVHVASQKISPWRFDVARNASLSLVPQDTDICVCTDLDERFNPGWRQELEKIYQPSITRYHYIYNWRLDQSNNPIISFYYDKIHTRQNFKWHLPVHEILEYKGIENHVYTSKIILNHYPDLTKSRASYLPLLQLSVKENPQNDRCLHYLGREYMYYGKWNKAIETLEKHLTLPTATWQDERSASMRFIARCYEKLNRPNEALMWLDKAIQETPYLRDPYLEKAIYLYQQQDYLNVKKLVKKALKIKINNRTYINEPFTFDHTPYDLLSLAEFYLGNYHKAYTYVNQAIKYSPNDERLQKNYAIIKAEMKQHENKSRSI